MRHGTSCICGGSEIRNVFTEEDGDEVEARCSCGGEQASGGGYLPASVAPLSGGLSEGAVDYPAPELRGAAGFNRCGPLAESAPFDVRWNQSERRSEESLRRLEK